MVLHARVTVGTKVSTDVATTRVSLAFGVHQVSQRETKICAHFPKWVTPRGRSRTPMRIHFRVAAAKCNQSLHLTRPFLGASAKDRGDMGGTGAFPSGSPFPLIKVVPYWPLTCQHFQEVHKGCKVRSVCIVPHTNIRRKAWGYRVRARV